MHIIYHNNVHRFFIPVSIFSSYHASAFQLLNFAAPHTFSPSLLTFYHEIFTEAYWTFCSYTFLRAWCFFFTCFNIHLLVIQNPTEFHNNVGRVTQSGFLFSRPTPSKTPHCTRSPISISHHFFPSKLVCFPRFF